MKFILLILVSLSLRLHAQTTTENRSASFGTALVGYQFLSTWIPSKWNVAYTQILNPQWSLEAEYLRGSIGFGSFGLDVAGISETRYSLVARRFVGNSFNFIIGAFHNQVEAQLGNDIVSDMTEKGLDEFEVSGSGLTLGMANRWQWGSGFTLGVDWFRMNLPLFNKRVDNDVLERIDEKNDLSRARDLMEKIKNIPTFVLLGIQLGYSF